MKRLGAVFVLLAMVIGLGLQADEVNVDIRKMTQATTGNQRFPVVAENARGQRIYAYRGGDGYAHFYYFHGGTWTGGVKIPGSPKFEDFWFADIVADSTGTFHYVCEDADSAMYYAYFKNGAWATMRKIDIRHEATLALGVRSDDTIVLVSAMVTRADKGVTKDVIIGTKAKDETNFTGWKNITNDLESSTMVDVAIDSEDNSWIAYKGAIFKGGGETLQAILLGLNKKHEDFYFKNVSGQEAAWCWYPRVAINADGKIMVVWLKSQGQTYYYRLYDTVTEKWTEVKEIMTGPVRPWPTMYNKILARGSEFYWVGLSSDRYVRLYRYNEEKDTWTKLADASDRAASWVSAYNGADSILIPWDSMGEPMACYLTTVTAEFAPIIRIQSVANLAVEKKVERGFFHGYALNALTWEANPLNAEQNIVVAAQRVYRKTRTADDSAWTLIAELGAAVTAYEDKNIAADSDFVYAVTCVDDQGAESPIVDPSASSSAANAPAPKARTARIDH